MEHFLPCNRTVKPVGIFSAVPNHEFCIGGYWFGGVEIYVEVDLTSNKVLLSCGVSEVYIMHPTASSCITAVYVLIHSIVLENLKINRNNFV